MQQGNRISVFISHSSHDKKWAREIGLFLVAEDVNVWFDEWELSAGDSFPEKISQGLDCCTHLILLWSKNASSSGWVKKELYSVISSSIQNDGDPKIIPVLLDETALPAILKDIKYIKYHDGDEDDRSLIINAVKGRPPTNNLIRAIVKKYNEIIYDNDRRDVLPYKACPRCGNENLKRSSQIDYERDKAYYFVDCPECNWGEWSN